jgi:uncharacterized protein
LSATLLDVNVLIALFWPVHEHHARAQAWFVAHARHGWATCPFTEAAFVRIISNPAFSQSAVTARDAVYLLGENLKHPNHVFWADTLSFADTSEVFLHRLLGHRQVTDAYLLGLTRHHRGRLLTLDGALESLLPKDDRSCIVRL